MQRYFVPGVILIGVVLTVLSLHGLASWLTNPLVIALFLVGLAVSRHQALGQR